MSDDQEELIRLRDRMHDLNNVVQATVLRHATMASDVAHLVAGFKEHREDSKAFMVGTSEELRAIREQTTKTNGRVNVIETRLAGHDQEFGDIKRHRSTHHEQRRSSDKPDAVTITIPAGALSPKTIATVIVLVIVGLMAAWKAGLFQ